MSRYDADGLVQCLKAPSVMKPEGRKRIKARSPKNAASEVEHDKNRAIRLQQNPICQRCGMYRASVVHHILRRTPKHSDHSLPNLMSLCDGPGSNGCHAAVHASPEDSYREGWMRRRWPKPGDHHYAPLDADGRLTPQDGAA